MVITPETIWQVPAYLPYVHPKLMPRTVLLAERQLGVKLPLEYLKLLEVQNGGFVRYVYRESSHSMFWGIGPELPSLLWHWGDELVAHAEGAWLPHDVRRLVPFDGDSYSYLCFDYRDRDTDAEPAVTYVEREDERERFLAPSFPEFVKLLTPGWDDHMFGVVGDLAPHRIAERLASTIGVRIRQTSLRGHEALTLELGNGAWIWVSSNVAPRAYDKSRYEGLEAQFAGNALRFPEHPEVTTLITCTEPAANAMRVACRDAGIGTVKLG
jgi:hypothetical protein